MVGEYRGIPSKSCVMNSDFDSLFDALKGGNKADFVPARANGACDSNQVSWKEE